MFRSSKINKKSVNSDNLIQKTALKTLQIECETINGLVNSINKEFVLTVNALHCCAGRLVVTGVGKSALIGQKIVSTLNSTGTPALFMHAADAIHGDLGMIQADDFVMCVSKSGETAEVKVLLPFLKSAGNKIIGMTAQKESYLGTQADFILHTPISQEADPNNLAPTASTTAQAAMGDALATSLLALRGFTPQDFAQFHPGGILGKQLYLRVRDLYPQHERPSVLKKASLRQTILEMTSKRLGCTAVLNKKGKIVGIITDGDLRRMLEKGEDISEVKAKNIMTRKPLTINANALAVNALEVMREKSITQLMVTENEVYVGVVHLHDLIREGLV